VEQLSAQGCLSKRPARWGAYTGSSPMKVGKTRHHNCSRQVAETLWHRGRHAAAEAEQQAIRRGLEVTMGNKSEAARLFRTDYKTLHLKMKNYGVDARRFRELHARRGSPV